MKETRHMKFHPKLSIILIILLLSLFCKADTFTVTTNADSGPGSLREAILDAAANGSSTTDYIVFNIADVTRAGRTILLNTALPDLSSDLIIDGTSQPGAAFGISDAKIQIEMIGYDPIYRGLGGDNLSDISIFGLYIKGQGSSGVGLYFGRIKNLQFGQPGKGNLVTGFNIAFYSDNFNQNLDRAENLSFQGNMMGLDESGTFTNNALVNASNFYINGVKNLIIGGLGNKEGNLLCDNYSAMDITYLRPDDAGYLKIHGNKFGTDPSGIIKISNPNSSDFQINGFNDGTDFPEGTTEIELSIINNIISGRIFIVKIKSKLIIQGNRIGVGADNITSLGNGFLGLIMLHFCGEGLIGGNAPADKNYFANANGSGIWEFHCGNITISRNSFFCNTQKGIEFNVWHFYHRPPPFVTINTINSTTVAGTSLPKSTVELFYDDACPGCEGKSYIGTTIADANGNWQYNGAFSGGIVATATDTLGATSEFSTATINTDSVIVKNATCGRNNGYVKKARVISGTDWYWQDESNNIIGRDSDLVNLAPGRYQLVATIGGSSCNAESIWFEVKNIEAPQMDTTQINITHPTCGLNNGALMNNAVFNNALDYSWVNQSDIILNADFEEDNPFDKLFPGNYFLKVRLKEDSTCFKKYGAFKLINQSGPQLNFDNIKINYSTCKKDNGSITNISYQSTTGNVYISWEDSVGVTVGKSIDINNLKAGKYRLKFKDESGCDTIITPYFNISDSGFIFIDSGAVQIKPSGCNASSGSITGFNITGAEQYQWVNINSNIIVGDNIDLINVPPGLYSLQLNNRFLCSNTLSPITVAQSGFKTINVNASKINDASCNIANGAVLITSFTSDTANFDFEWRDSSGVIKANTSLLTNVDQGKYELYATDENGCTEKIFQASLQQLGIPVFEYNEMLIKPDTCNMHIGSITNLNVKGGRVPYTWGWTNAASVFVSDKAFIAGMPQHTYIAVVKDQNLCITTSKALIIPNIETKLNPPRVTDQDIPRNTAAIIAVINPQQGKYELLSDANGSTIIGVSDEGIFETALIREDRSFFIRYSKGDCSSELSALTIKVFDSTFIYVPNTFTPNRDGKNDVWRPIIYGKLNSFSISVYNRWGQIVYFSDNIKNTWDGTFKGNNLPAGLFLYSITAKDYRNKPVNIKGYVTIMR
ncbi:MAG: hypothetical protein BGP13_24625 [Sphingobacteriales bacterium 40-81]|nr:MAG: hypothetical protein BGP13_24625 [Sphingobacteriales bacterium 40-81]